MNPKNIKFAKEMAEMFAAPGSAINGIFGDAMASRIEGDETAISGICVITGKSYAIKVSTEGWRKWIEDRSQSIAECWPDLSRDDAEWMRAGISPEGWRSVFGKK